MPHPTIAINLGSLHARVFIATRLQREHGLRPVAVYVQWQRRVYLQWPRRKNFAKPYDADLTPAEALRTWQGLTIGDPGCDPSYKATRTWPEIASDPSVPPGAMRYARDQVAAMASVAARHEQLRDT